MMSLIAPNVENYATSMLMGYVLIVELRTILKHYLKSVIGSKTMNNLVFPQGLRITLKQIYRLG
jgi:hypothetical protein